MTPLALAIAGTGLTLVWAAWTGESPIDVIRKVIAGE